MSGPIPADILKTAEALFEPYVALYDGPGEEDVARLILAERKRCAALARAEEEEQRAKHKTAEPNLRLVHGVGAEIALKIVAAIEDGRQP